MIIHYSASSTIQSSYRHSAHKKNGLKSGVCEYLERDGTLLPKLFLPTVKKNCCSDREKLLKLEAEGQEFAKILRSLEQFIQTVKGQNNFW